MNPEKVTCERTGLDSGRLLTRLQAASRRVDESDTSVQKCGLSVGNPNEGSEARGQIVIAALVSTLIFDQSCYLVTV